MKLTHIIAALSLTIAASACKKKEEAKTTDQPTTTATEGTPKTAEPPKAEAKGRKIPNSDGLVVDAPAKWVDNGIGGAAGMHLEGDAGQFQVRETSEEEGAKKLADFKTDTEAVLFQKWVSADETVDGFKTVYVIDKMVTKGEELVKDGSAFAFHVRRKIGDKSYECYGSAATQETAVEAAELCMKIEAS